MNGADPIAMLMSQLMATKPVKQSNNDGNNLLLNELKNPGINNNAGSAPIDVFSSNNESTVKPPLDLLQSLIMGTVGPSGKVGGDFYGTSVFDDLGEYDDDSDSDEDPLEMFKKMNIASQRLKEAHSKAKHSSGPVSEIDCPILTVNVDAIDAAALPRTNEHTVASLRRDLSYYPGKLVASNSVYIAYSSKSGVRLIRHQDGEYTLLKDHEGPVIDLELSSISIDNTSKLVSVGSDGHVVIQEFANGISNGKIKPRTVFEITAPSAGAKLIHRCAFSSDGNRVLLVSQNCIYEVKLAMIQKKDGHRYSYDSLEGCGFIRAQQNNISQVTSANFLANSHDLAVGFIDGSVQIFSQHSNTYGVFFFEEWTQPVNSLAAVAGKTPLVIVGFEMNRRLFVFDYENNVKVQELFFESDGISFVNYFYHEPTSSLYAASSGAAALMRFEMVNGYFEPREMYGLPDIALSVNAEKKMLDDLELFVVSEKEITILTIATTFGQQSSIPEEIESFNDQHAVKSVEEEAADKVSDEISSRIVKEAISTCSTEIAAHQTADKKKGAFKESFDKRHEEMERHGFAPTMPQLPGPVELKLPPTLELEFLINSLLDRKLAKIEEQRSKAEFDNGDFVNQVDSIVGMHLQAFSEDLDENLPLVVKGVVDQCMDSQMKKMETLFKNTMASQMRNIIADKTFSKNLTDAISENMKVLMTANFETVLIPAYQTATQVMFKQMQSAFQQGLTGVMNDFKQSVTAGISQETSSKSLTSEIGKQINKVSERQIKILEEIDRKLNRIGGNRSPVPAAAVRQKSIHEEIAESVARGEFEAAFTKALESSNLEILIHLISNISPSDVFVMGGHPVLSQPVLLSLIQQLSVSLAENTELKFTWIQESLASIDARHALIAEYSKQVLSTLVMKLDEWAQQVSRENPANPSLLTAKLLMRLANSLCMF